MALFLVDRYIIILFRYNGSILKCLIIIILLLRYNGSIFRARKKVVGFHVNYVKNITDERCQRFLK